jgi:hypothetical protein
MLHMVDATASATLTSPVARPLADWVGTYRPVQVEVTSAATVKIKGRVAPSAPWHVLSEVTATGIENILMTGEMIIDITGNDGAVSVWVGAYGTVGG